ncbi:MAG: TetR family transcriptional regulator [Chloroflexi bacterium]|nr:TetR family transcriptional regulator [Chloroflexota bacterium]
MSLNKKQGITFIEKARRKQIVEAAIASIAAQGYINTTIATIAAEVETSKGVINYHFDGKNSLIEATIQAILMEQWTFIKKDVEKQSSARQKLRAYIGASFEFMKAYRSHVVAWVDLWGSFSSIEEKRDFNIKSYEPCRRHLQKILDLGWETGEFRQFNSSTLSSLIQAAIDGAMLQWVFDESSVDLDECSDMLCAMFDQFARKEGVHGESSS